MVNIEKGHVGTTPENMLNHENNYLYVGEWVEHDESKCGFDHAGCISCYPNFLGRTKDIVRGYEYEGDTHCVSCTKKKYLAKEFTHSGDFIPNGALGGPHWVKDCLRENNPEINYLPVGNDGKSVEYIQWYEEKYDNLNKPNLTCGTCHISI